MYLFKPNTKQMAMYIFDEYAYSSLFVLFIPLYACVAFNKSPFTILNIIFYAMSLTSAMQHNRSKHKFKKDVEYADYFMICVMFLYLVLVRLMTPNMANIVLLLVLPILGKYSIILKYIIVPIFIVIYWNHVPMIANIMTILNLLVYGFQTYVQHIEYMSVQRTYFWHF